MPEHESIATLAEAVITELVESGRTVATAESCTGGWIAKALTDVSGSSAAFGFGIVSYSNDAKVSLLGVDAARIEQDGAVSESVVRRMARGAVDQSGADLAVAVSGIAGPDGGSAEKPVGTIWISWAARDGDNVEVAAARHHLKGDRESIRSQTVVLALQGLRETLRKRG